MRETSTLFLMRFPAKTARFSFENAVFHWLCYFMSVFFYTKKLRKTAFSIIFYYKTQKIWNRPTYPLVLSRIRRAYEIITFTSGNLHQVACKCDVMQIIRRVAWDPLFLMARIAYPDHPFPQKIPFQIPGFGVRIPPVKSADGSSAHNWIY